VGYRGGRRAQMIGIIQLIFPAAKMTFQHIFPVIVFAFSNGVHLAIRA
jgi:hypothetical protein